jgi:hypothetical protein
MGIRLELFQPGLQFVNPDFFNQLTTMHALIMVFGAIMPAFVGFANWMVPMIVGAPDMALPRMNNWSFWILRFAFTLVISTFFMEGGAPAAGWTMYPPLVLQGAGNVPFMIFAVHLLGMSSIMGAINYHGVLAPNARLRALVTAHAGRPLPGALEPPSPRPAPRPSTTADEPTRRSPASYLWVALLARISAIAPALLYLLHLTAIHGGQMPEPSTNSTNA